MAWGGGVVVAAPPFPSLVQINVNAAQQDPPNDNANEPMMVIDPSAPSRIFVAWNHFDFINGKWSYFQCAYAVSLDGGRTWSPRAQLEPGVRRANPHATVDHTGKMVFGSARVDDFGFYFVSLWDAERVGGPLTNRREVVGGDKPWIWADTHPDSPGRGNLYSSWNSVVNLYSPGIFSRSFDRGVTWGTPVGMAASPSLGSLATGPDGAVYLSGIVNIEPSNLFMLARSDDARLPGVSAPTFTVGRVPLNNAVFPVGVGPNPGGPLQQVQTIVDPSGPRRGWVYYLTSADPTGSDPCNIYFTRSSDRGATWSTPIKVNTDADGQNSWQWMAAMSLAPNGRLDVIWLDSRGTRDNSTHRLYYRSSSDGGATWGAEQELSGPFNVRSGFGYQKKIGDYFTLVSDNLGASAAWTSTLKGGQDVYFTRIGPEDCNRNGVSDAAEIASGAVEDCNDNGVPDSCDIAAGLEFDGDGNGVPDSCEGKLCAATDYNRDGVNDLADLADFITDFYTFPAIPGGMQLAAPSYAGERVGFVAACANAPDAPPPYAAEGYRVGGYRVGFSPDGSNACPVSRDQVFPNLDHLSDFISAYFGPEAVCPPR